MSSLDNLKARINYRGGSAIERMKQDKLRGLHQALHYSYQAETAVLADGRAFKCLINPNKISMELDDKMLSIPFEDVCVNWDRSESRKKEKEQIGVKVGDTIVWQENGTHWLVYMQYLQEDAYFRGLMRQCDTEVSVNGKSYWVYLKGPSEKGINWQKTNNFVFNKLNYTLEMYISKDQNTNEFFQRFKKLKVQGKPWEVQAVDSITTEGIIAVYLKEDYTNEFEDTTEEPLSPEEETPVIPEEPAPESMMFRMRRPEPQITGPAEVHAFDVVSYTIEGVTGGIWSLSNKRARIAAVGESSVEIEITTGKSGSVTLIYTIDGMEIKHNISILSL